MRRVRAVRAMKVLDESGRMLLVEAPRAELEALVESMPDWILSEEKAISLPDPRPMPRRTP